MRPWVKRMKDAVKIYKAQGWKGEINWDLEYCAADRFDADGNRIEDGYFLQGQGFYELVNECPKWFSEKDWIIFQIENYCIN